MNVVGIDLGTTSARIAVSGDRGIELLSVDGSATNLSAVVSVDVGSVMVGQKAVRRAVTHPKRTVRRPKMLLGRLPTDTIVKQRVEPWSCRLNEDPTLVLDLDGQERTVEQLVAAIFDYLLEQARAHIGSEPSKVVIGLPEWFGDSQRAALAAAMSLSGLSSAETVSEAVAASLGMRLEVGDRRRVALVDIGACTTTVALVSAGGQAPPKLLAVSSGTTGGEDVDKALIKRALVQLEVRADDPGTYELIRQTCEDMKIELSSTETSRRQLQHVFPAASNTRISFNRIILARAVEPLLLGLKTRISWACRDARVKAESIDEVYLIGGLSQNPLVIKNITRLFGQPPKRSPFQSGAVATGAAIHGCALLEQEQRKASADHKAAIPPPPPAEENTQPLEAPETPPAPPGPESTDADTEGTSARSLGAHRVAPNALSGPPAASSPEATRATAPATQIPVESSSHTAGPPTTSAIDPSVASSSAQEKRETPMDALSVLFEALDVPSEETKEPIATAPPADEDLQSPMSVLSDALDDPSEEPEQPIATAPPADEEHQPPIATAPSGQDTPGAQEGAPQERDEAPVEIRPEPESPPEASPETEESAAAPRALPSQVPESPVKHPTPKRPGPSRFTAHSSVLPAQTTRAPLPDTIGSGELKNPKTVEELYSMPLNGPFGAEDLEEVALPVLLLRVVARPSVVGKLTIVMEGYGPIDIPVVHGRLKPTDLNRRNLIKTISQRNGLYKFEPSAPPKGAEPPEALALYVLMLPIVTEILRTWIKGAPPEDLAEALGERLYLSPVMSAHRRKALTRLQLTSKETRFANKIFDGTWTGEDIITKAGGTNVALQLLNILVLLDLLDWVEVEVTADTSVADELKARADRIASATYYEVLQLHWSSPIEEIEAGYQKLLERTSVNGDWHNVSEDDCRKIRERVEEAYEILHDEERRMEYLVEAYRNVDCKAYSNVLTQRAQTAAMRENKSEYDITVARLKEVRKIATVLATKKRSTIQF